VIRCSACLIRSWVNCQLSNSSATRSNAPGRYAMTPAGTGFVTVSDADGNSSVYDYDQGTLAVRRSVQAGRPRVRTV
jgi:hypothetical protein